MPFCCIAIVGVAMMYFTFLSLRHLFIGPRRSKVSPLPAPPRAVTGNHAQPVWGHTSLYSKLGGDIALLFPSDMREWRWLPHSWSRRLGEVFCLFIWGQWRTVIIGPERTKLILDSQNVQDGWAWTPPVTLLGKSCIPLLDEKEADFLMGLLRVPFSQGNVGQLAHEFADIAEKFMDDFVSGELNRKFDTAYDRKERRKRRDGIREGVHDETIEEGCAAAKRAELESEHTNVSSCESKWLKLKWDAMRSYTLDLIEGPVLGMNMWETPAQQSHGEATTEKETKERAEPSKKDEIPYRARMMLWMDRLKVSLCVIKIPMGPEWMYLWPLTEYGRATIARQHLLKVVSKHVADRSELISDVHHGTGHYIQDAAALSFPLKAWAENIYYRNEGVTGSVKRSSMHTRQRSQSEPVLCEHLVGEESNDWKPSLSPTAEHPLRSPPPAPSFTSSTFPTPVSNVTGNRARAMSSPQVSDTSRKQLTEMARLKSKKPTSSILDQMLGQHDSGGAGISKAVATELSILLYMILDAGNAWTSMALNLLALDHSALKQVEDELSHLTILHGKDELFSPGVMGQMRYLDALIWESIRLCPSFLGGMKVLSETVELPDDGVQIPKNSHVIFCNPTERNFDLSEAWGKRPHELAFLYPCPEVHGFLPFKGLEIPLMVMQSKVFIIRLLQRFEPHISKKRTFIRRVKDAMHKTHSHREKITASVSADEVESGMANRQVSTSACSDVDSEIFPGKKNNDLTTSEAMRLYTKIPFPEPRVVLHVNEREPKNTLY